MQSYEKSSAEQKFLIFFMPRQSKFALEWAQKYEKMSEPPNFISAFPSLSTQIKIDQVSVSWFSDMSYRHFAYL